jgi:hypothetical protein
VPSTADNNIFSASHDLLSIKKKMRKQSCCENKIFEQNHIFGVLLENHIMEYFWKTTVLSEKQICLDKKYIWGRKKLFGFGSTETSFHSARPGRHHRFIVPSV